jgi:hypothetical protein
LLLGLLELVSDTSMVVIVDESIVTSEPVRAVVVIVETLDFIVVIVLEPVVCVTTSLSVEESLL